MKWPDLFLAWIVSWRVLTTVHGVPVVRHRNAIFADKAAAEAFKASQEKAGRHCTLREKTK